MNNFNIIEDCSPYFIRFKHDGIEDLINYCRTSIPYLPVIKNFKYHLMSQEQSSVVISKTPVSSVVPLQKNRASFFISAPGLYYRAHKDGANHRFSINYPIVISDDKCITSWYSDEDLKNYKMDYMGGWSRECSGFNPKNHTPLKNMSAKVGECILFNTEIFHDWDNSKSENYRIVLTLRAEQSLRGSIYYEDAKKMIFEN